jgi:protein-tyrosine phosphatase
MENPNKQLCLSGDNNKPQQIKLFEEDNEQKSKEDIVGCDEIIKNLYLGSLTSMIFLRDRCSDEILKKWSVVTVLSSEEATILCDLPDRLCDYLFIEAEDDPQQKIYHRFDETYIFIKDNLKKGIKVLVHCGAGISRSSTIVCAFLIRNSQIPYTISIKYIREKRSIVRPNSGFRKQLKTFENKLTLQSREIIQE